jgi:hypothetical protein
MTVFREGDLEFTFGPSWTVLKYDENGSYYKTTLDRQVKPTKAVDFLCWCSGEPLLMLEVKDFSRAVPAREKFAKIPMVVAIKTRDTLAGIIGGSHHAAGPEQGVFQKSYRKLSTPPRVIYFFEDLATSARRPPQRTKDKRDVLLKLLKSRLRWLTREVMVVGLTNYDSAIKDLTIRKV